MSLRIGIFGGAGRMGKMLVREVLDDEETTLAGACLKEGEEVGRTLAEIVERPANDELKAALLTISPEKMMNALDVAIDFTRPEVSVHNAYVAAATGKPIVIGTTGFSQDQLNMLSEAGNHIPIVLAPNMSVGVNMLQALTQMVAQALEPKWDIEVLEMHHRHKIDAPSGTALALGEAAAEGRKVQMKAKGVYDRKGAQGPRKRGDIGFAVLRGGDVVGEHTVMFAGDGERIELSHRATDRRVFAQGALVAAKWIAHQQPGRYGMKDVLGF